ncbi:MAG TPA: LLM class flavin-dependent oxidoreductase [Rhizomicrobium sp.]|jgi:alkanesulfonate monooxygenase SsuD/methylene tetrahydromethanopterin reductase-like flavin-dependent oxidoreductase (luciferase family)
MKLSYLCSASYDGPGHGGGWPAAPSSCDRATARQSMEQALANARLAEALGFDWVSVSEHHYSPIMLTPNPIVMAGALSQVTERVKIAVLGPLIPLNNPVRIAEELAMLDCLTNGRVIVLFLRGTPNEHGTYSDVAARSRAMTQEGIDLILKAWSSPEPFAWNGSEYQFPTVSVWPRTLQTPHPVVFGSGNSDESIDFAASRRLPIAISFAPANVVKGWVERYRAAADKAGWMPGPDHVLYRHLAHIAASDAAATEEMHEASAARARAAAQMASPAAEMGGPGAQPRTPPPAFFTPYFFGGPKTVIARAEEMRNAGVGILDLAFIIPGGERQAQALKTFAAAVMPALAKM